MAFDFDSQTRRRLGYQLIDQVDEYFSSLPDRPVQSPSDQRSYGLLHDSLPESGMDPAAILDETWRELVRQGFHVPSANYFGLMNPTPTYMGFLGEALVSALNPQLATLARSQLASKIEIETVRWIGERVGWPGDFSGTFTSGGNEANFSGLALALACKFPRAIEDGIASIGAQPVAYASAESHHSLDKSAGLLGFGRKGLRRIPVDARAQMDPAQLEAAIQDDVALGKKPFCVVATAGTTNSGSIDDVARISEICRRYDLWMHVDGAYGAAVIFSNQHRGTIPGLELADSLTIDPHKWLAVPFAAGVILTCHPETLTQAFSVAAPYMPRAGGATLPDNARISTQWTRRMNSLKLWLSLRVHGRQAYEELITRQFQLSRSFADWLRASAHFELAVEPALPIVTFRLKSRELNKNEDRAAHDEIVEEVTRDGQCWISETLVRGESVIRMMVISYLTEERHLEDLQQRLISAATKVKAAARRV